MKALLKAILAVILIVILVKVFQGGTPVIANALDWLVTQSWTGIIGLIILVVSVVYIVTN